MDTVDRTISWAQLSKYLRDKLEQTRSRLDDEGNDQERDRLQGEIRVLKVLARLPESLALLAEEDQRVLEEKRHGIHAQA